MPAIAELGGLATASLLGELATTPKPGLVDREHRGSHRDLCYGRLEASALALESTFAHIARTAAGAKPSRALREELGELGRRGERAMLRESLGANTHRGALFSLGLLVAAAAALPGERNAAAVAATAGDLARLPDRFSLQTYSHGAAVARTFGVVGARGEASSRFPHVVRLALPQLRNGVAPSDVLLALMAQCADTCVLHRGGRRGLLVAQTGARHALALGASASARGRAAIGKLDAVLVALNVSPGGSADLLAAALFLGGITSS